jgi:hypothetical protein
MWKDRRKMQTATAIKTLSAGPNPCAVINAEGYDGSHKTQFFSNVTRDFSITQHSRVHPLNKGSSYVLNTISFLGICTIIGDGM